MKVGNDEIETVKGLMSMSLYACVSEALDVDINEVEPSMTLFGDLKMNTDNQGVLVAQIADMFDGVTIDIQQDSTVESLLDQVVGASF